MSRIAKSLPSFHLFVATSSMFRMTRTHWSALPWKASARRAKRASVGWRREQGHLFLLLARLVPAAFLSFVGLAAAQGGQPSFVPQICGQYDCVNLQNLNVSLNVPVMSKSGAFPFRAALEAGDTSFATGELIPGIVTLPIAPVIDGILSPFGYTQLLWGNYNGISTCPSQYGTGPAVVYSELFLKTPDGTTHPLPPDDQVFVPSSGTGSTCASTLTDQVADGTGWTITINGSTYEPFNNTTLAGVTLVSSGGMTLTAEAIQDAQSSPNEITYSSSTKEFTDTMGMEALTINASANGQLGWFDSLGNTQTESQTLTSATLETSFGCSGQTDYPATSYGPGLTTKISFLDGSDILLGWEPNEVTSTNYTGRLSEITERGGGTVKFNYNPGGATTAPYGYNCTYGMPNSMTRKTSDGTVTFTVSGLSSFGSTTTVLDIGQNKTIYTFSTGAVDADTTVLTQMQYFLNTGTVAAPAYSSTATNTVTYCYNAGASPTVSSCPTALVREPITQLAVFTSPNGLSASESYQTFDRYGNVTYSAQYDFGGTSPLVATTNTMAVNGSGNCSGIGATINNKVCSFTTAILGNTVGDSKYTYSGTGNLLTALYSPDGGTSFVGCTTSNSYKANGTPSTLYDANCNQTIFAYSSSYYTDCSGCTQYPFATSRTKGGLTTYSYWNGYGGVKTEEVDASGNDTFYCYNNTTGTSCNGTVADPWSRVMAIIDPLNNEVFKTYSATSLTSDFSFGTSVNNITTTLDGYGRTINVQKQQGPSASNYDTVSTYRSFSGVIPSVQTTNPCSQSSGSQCPTTYGPTASGKVLSGGIFESILTQTGSNAVVKTTYDEGDVTSILGPAPSGENTKGTESEYNGAGWLTSTCAISSVVSGEVSCNQRTGGNNGIVTTVSYSSATGSRTVKSCRGPSGSQQCRTTVTDGLGRLTSKTTPEGGTWTYKYDQNTSCPSGWQGVSGKLASVKDPNLNLLCYSYDSLNRVTGINANNGTTCRWFYYDNGEGNGTASGGYTGTVPTGITLSNQYGRMVEATTDSCTAVASHTSSTLTTDLWWTYDKDGHQTTQWESTPNSGGYYEATATFFGNGAVDELTLASPSITTDTYTLDGGGRWNSMYAGGYQIVAASGVTFNPAGQPTAITIAGSTQGVDNYTYDPNTLNMTQYQFQVGSGSSNTDTGVLSWNSIGSLKSLVITDDFNSGGSMTCDYNSSLKSGTGYDDLNRLIGFYCTGAGGTWSQAFGFNDPYDNLTKTGSGLPSWNPGYSQTTNHYTCTGCTYDSDGNVTNDGANAYTWNPFSKMASVNMSGTGCATNGDCIVYDALGRVVEIDDGSTKEEIWYTQLGKTAFMNGQTYLYSYFPGPGGGTLYNSTACPTCWMHKDWVGNARLVSRGTTVETDRAYAPYGEVFDVFGGTNQPWTMFGGGSTQDILAGMYDTPNRELPAIQSRFLSPDPAGFGWNQYAYPTNPNSEVDPSGLIAYLGPGLRGVIVPDHPCPSSGTVVQARCLSGSGPGSVSGTCNVDGLDEDCGMASPDATVQCPNNACSGFANTQFVQFIAGAGGAQGYVNFSNIAQGLNEWNGSFYTNSQFETLINQMVEVQREALADAISNASSSADGSNWDAIYASLQYNGTQGGHADFTWVPVPGAPDEQTDPSLDFVRQGAWDTGGCELMCRYGSFDAIHYNNDMFHLDTVGANWGYGLGLLLHGLIDFGIGNINPSVPIFQ